MLETTLFLPVWTNSSVTLASRYSRPRVAVQWPLPAGGRPVAALVYHALRQPQPKGEWRRRSPGSPAEAEGPG